MGWRHVQTINVKIGQRPSHRWVFCIVLRDLDFILRAIENEKKIFNQGLLSDEAEMIIENLMGGGYIRTNVHKLSTN